MQFHKDAALGLSVSSLIKSSIGDIQCMEKYFITLIANLENHQTRIKFMFAYLKHS